MYRPPMMGIDDWAPGPSVDVPVEGRYASRSGRLLGRVETIAREKAERERREELRSHDNVVLLEDWEAIEGQEADLC